MMNTLSSYTRISEEVDVWDGLDDVDLVHSISYNTLDNEYRAHECT